MSQYPDTFDAWWVSEHGHPPDSAEQKRAFEDARIGWGFGQAVGQHFLEAKLFHDTLSKSSQGSFRSAFCQSIVFHIKGEEIDAENLCDLLSFSSDPPSSTVDEDVFFALSEGRKLGQRVAEVLNDSVDYKATASAHKFAASTFGMISSFRKDASLKPTLGIVERQARQLLAGTIYGTNEMTLGIPISELQDL